MIKRYLVSMFLCLAFIVAVSQTTVKQEQDSLEQMWQNRIDSIAKAKRVIFF